MSMTKDKSLTENLRTDTKPGMLGDTGGSMVRDTKPGMLGDDGGSIKRDTTPNYLQEADKRGYENIGKKVESTNQIGRANADQVLADRNNPNRFTGITGPQKPDPYQDAIMRGEKGFGGVRREKPGIQKTVSTQLKSVRTALSPLAKAVGFVMNPIKGLIGAAAGMVKDTPTQAHARKFFNTTGNTSRISGNPAEDLYAGMNQTSAFGNLEKSGEKRIATREATIARKGYKAGDKFFDNTQKMKKDQSTYKNDKDTNVVDKGFTRTRAERKANPGRQDANTMSGGGGNGGNGGRVICTELHSAGEMSTKDWIRDTQFTFKGLTPEHVKGYLFWAIPTVVHMKKYPKYRKIWKHIAQHRANDIAWRLNQGKFDLLGRLYAGIGEPLCWLLGNFVGNKEFNELNIKNWRKI